MEPSRFPVEPWTLREIGLSGAGLAQSESLFALSNGHIGVRGNLDEGDPNGLPGTYLNSFFEKRPLPYAESGYGYPESGQTVLNVTDGKIIRLLIDDEPLDLRYGTIVHHERVLDLRRGRLERWVEWQSPAGTRVRVHSQRIVSMARRSLLAVRYEVQPVDAPIRIVVQSEMVADEKLPAQSNDPRVATMLENPLKPVYHEALDGRAHLLHRTENSGLKLAVSMSHHPDSTEGLQTETFSRPDWARWTAATRLEPGQRFGMTKFVAYGWSSQRTVPSLRDQVDAALVSAQQVGWDGVADEQAEHLERFWDGADVEIDGAPEIQQAVRIGMFHAYQAGARAEQRAIPAKGLTGPGYDGHAFWDTEMFVLPLLTATAPDAAADALRWRLSTLDLARERAETLHLSGATFPWRTIRGEECSAYWPAGTAALHVNAGIATAAARHVVWTGDAEFGREVALPLLVATARLWAGFGYDGADGRFHLDGVTGPDEYSAVVDDNTYTNLMARRNLLAAVLAARSSPDESAALGVDDDEVHRWSDCAERMAMPVNADLGVHEQDRGSTLRAVWDFERSAKEDRYPLLLHSPYFEIYRKQVVKQADLVLAMHWAGDMFSAAEKARNFAYYEPLTVRDSSLSACTQAVIAAEVGQHDLALDYLAEAALMDLRDLEHNSGDGLHIASLAGAWLAVVAGFGGLRDHGTELAFRPQLPEGWVRLCFRLQVRGGRLRVEIGRDAVSYLWDGAGSLPIDHLDGDEVTRLDLEPGAASEHAWSTVDPLTAPPQQPAGRAPGHALVS